MKPLLFSVVLTCVFLGVAQISNANPSQYCNELYSLDDYEYTERNRLVQECLSEQTNEAEQNAKEPDYYEGTVDDYVKQLPIDSPPESK